MTARRVDAAVVVIERRDPSLGQWVQAAADGLTAGEGEEILCHAFVQTAADRRIVERPSQPRLRNRSLKR